jgi:sugar phosphate isomerase/epimerase
MMSKSYTFGYSEFTTWPWSFKKDIEAYRRHGADVVEVCEFKLPHNDYSDLVLLRESGLTASSIQMKVHSIFVDSMAGKPEDPADRIHTMKEAITASAPHLPPGTPFIVITGIPPDKNVRKAVERTIEGLKELGEHAAAHDMRIAFEPLSPVNIHTDTAVWYLDQGLDVVERVNHPAVGICLDSWNVWQTPDLAGVIAQCAKRIFIVQLSDWNTPRSTADRYSLGSGTIAFVPLLRAIRQTGYDGPYVIEILSSLHLEGSLWKADMDRVLDENRTVFERLWKESA